MVEDEDDKEMIKGPKTKKIFKELLLCHVVKCNFLFYLKEIRDFFYFKNYDKLSFALANQNNDKEKPENNVVVFEMYLSDL